MTAMPKLLEPPLIERLPPVRGRYKENAPLSGITWFRVGGSAEVMFRPADRADLLDFLQAKPDDVPVTVTLRYATGETQNVVVGVTDRVTEARVPLAGTLRDVDVNRDFEALARIEDQ